jgi:glucokinase
MQPGRKMGKKKKAKKVGKKYWVGIDLGGTKMLVGLFKKDFTLVASEKVKVHAGQGEKALLKSLKEALHSILQKSKVQISQIAAAGIGCPGIIDSDEGKVIVSPNLPFLKNNALARKVSALFKFPVVLGNDVNTGLFGEQQFGAAKHASHAVGIFLGTGIGGALIIDGKIYVGSGGAAGEIGHMHADPLGPQCGCGRRGCLEAMAGRVAIASEAAVLAAKHKAPRLYDIAGTDISKIKSGALAKAIYAGDEAILHLIEQKARLLGIAMANLVNVLNPELIVLGGGVIEALGKFMIPEAVKSMHQHAMPGLGKQTEVVAAKLGDHAIILGAAKMAADSLEEKD